MANDPVYIADCVMHYLFTSYRESIGREAIRQLVTSDGTEDEFFLAWGQHGKQDQIIVGLGEGNEGESNVKLMVNFYDLDLSALKENLPLSSQALHKVEQFEDGRWAEVLLGGLHKLREDVA